MLCQLFGPYLIPTLCSLPFHQAKHTFFHTREPIFPSYSRLSVRSHLPNVVCTCTIASLFARCQRISCVPNTSTWYVQTAGGLAVLAGSLSIHPNGSHFLKQDFFIATCDACFDRLLLLRTQHGPHRTLFVLL
jgi:hypothetical protein